MRGVYVHRADRVLTVWTIFTRLEPLVHAWTGHVRAEIEAVVVEGEAFVCGGKPLLAPDFKLIRPGDVVTLQPTGPIQCQVMLVMEVDDLRTIPGLDLRGVDEADSMFSGLWRTSVGPNFEGDRFDVTDLQREIDYAVEQDEIYVRQRNAARRLDGVA